MNFKKTLLSIVLSAGMAYSSLFGQDNTELEAGRARMAQIANDQSNKEVHKEIALKHFRSSLSLEGVDEAIRIHKSYMESNPMDEMKYLDSIVSEYDLALSLVNRQISDFRERREKREEITAKKNKVLLHLAHRSERAGEHLKAVDYFRSLGDHRSANNNITWARGVENIEKRKDHLTGYERIKQGNPFEARKYLVGPEHETLLKVLDPSDEPGKSLKSFRDHVSKKDKTGLEEKIAIIASCLPEDSLRKDAVMLSSSLYNKNYDWDSLAKFGDMASQYAKQDTVTVKDVFKTADQLMNIASRDPRPFVRANLIKQVEQLYLRVAQMDTDVKTKASALMAIEKLPKVELTELPSLDDLMIAGLNYNIPKGAVLFMTFDAGTIVSGDGIQKGNILNKGKGRNWYVKDLSGEGNHGLINGNFAVRDGKPIVYDRHEDVPAEYDLALVKGPSGKRDDHAMYFAGKNGWVEVGDDLNSYLKNDFYFLIKTKSLLSSNNNFIFGTTNPRLYLNLYRDYLSVGFKDIPNQRSDFRAVLNEWQNLNLKFDKTGINIVVNEKPSNRSFEYSSINLDENIFIGGLNGTNYRYIGIIDEFLVFK
jgi:hypothetical protein